jgi:signal transduction histidine kinase
MTEPQQREAHPHVIEVPVSACSQVADAHRATALMLGYVSHELRNPLNGVMGLIHLCLSVVTPLGSTHSSRAASADHNTDDLSVYLGDNFLKGIESPSREELVSARKRASSSRADVSKLLNRSWPGNFRGSDELEAGSNPFFPPGALLGRSGSLRRLPSMGSPSRGGGVSAGASPGRDGPEECGVCHGLVYDNLSLADKSCELMKTIMGDLLDMQRLEAGQAIMSRSAGTLLDVIRHVTRLAETQHLLHAEAAEAAFRVKSHSRRFTMGDAAAVERAVKAEETPPRGGNARPENGREADPPGKKVRGKWEWVQADGSRIGEGRAQGRAILRYFCDAEVSGNKYDMDRARMEQVGPWHGRGDRPRL